MTDTPDRPAPMSALHAALRLGGGFIVAVFGLGIAAGVAAAVREQGRFGLGGAIGSGLALLAIVAGAWLALSVRHRFPLPRSPRVRRSRVALYASLGISLVVGVLAGIVAHLEGGASAFGMLFTSAPVSALVALCTAAGWIVAVAVSVYWHLTLDEIERAEYEFGATLALYAYVLVAPIWWLAWRGGLVAEPDEIAIYAMVCVIWCIGWAWRRLR
ncbi:hypothetical protein [Novosphingobium soli]|uniref:Uncharacterized protein n=1 Tax=Novosphingobium soli TaxID=574956 RepID=A0ABV6CQZ7_9SPHN